MDRRSQEQQLLRRCLAHDRDAWADLVDRYSRLIYGVIYETLRHHAVPGSEDLAEELFHQTFLALYDRNYRKLRQWDGRCALASWIRLVTASLVVDHLRRRRPMSPLGGGDEPTPLPEALVDDTRAPEADLVDLEQAQQVRSALAKLRAPDRELLLLLFRDELKPGAAAAALGIRPGALYTRKNRALARLREAVLEQRANTGPS